MSGAGLGALFPSPPAPRRKVKRTSWKRAAALMQIACANPALSKIDVEGQVDAISIDALDKTRRCKCAAYVFAHLAGIGLCDRGAKKRTRPAADAARIDALEKRVEFLEEQLGVGSTAPKKEENP